MSCLERFSPQDWGGGEDGFFAFHMALMGGQVATLEDAAKFSTQDYFTHRSFAAHAIQLLNEADKLRFLEYCPEAGDIFSVALRAPS